MGTIGCKPRNQSKYLRSIMLTSRAINCKPCELQVQVRLARKNLRRRQWEKLAGTIVSSCRQLSSRFHMHYLPTYVTFRCG